MGAKDDFVERYPHLVYSPEPDSVYNGSDETGYLFIMLDSTDHELPDFPISIIGVYDSENGFIAIDPSAISNTVIEENENAMFVYRICLPAGSLIVIVFDDNVGEVQSRYKDDIPIPFSVNGNSVLCTIPKLAIDSTSMPPANSISDMIGGKYPLIYIAPEII